MVTGCDGSKDSKLRHSMPFIEMPEVAYLYVHVPILDLWWGRAESRAELEYELDYELNHELNLIFAVTPIVSFELKRCHRISKVSI
jgi:hypothetical protein